MVGWKVSQDGEGGSECGGTALYHEELEIFPLSFSLHMVPSFSELSV